MNFKSTLDRGLRGSSLYATRYRNLKSRAKIRRLLLVAGVPVFTCAPSRQLEIGFEGPSHELRSMATPIKTQIRHRCRTFVIVS